MVRIYVPCITRVDIFVDGCFSLLPNQIGKITIGHDGTGTGPEYDFQKLLVQDYHESRNYRLTCQNPPCFVANFPMTAMFEVPPVVNMTQWNPWGSCTPCPTGTKKRYRPCLAEYPQFGLTCITGQTPGTTSC